MSHRFPDAPSVMRHAIELARRGEGHVEPNPMVGAVIVDDDLRTIGEGWHEVFGGPHAEINALRQAGERAAGATLYVTLEPCCHYGKTPPCSRAVIAAGLRRVVIGMTDPAPHVAGGGIAELAAAGVDVEVGLLAEECAALTAPFIKLTTTGRPWVHAKWAMTLDGKIATRTGASQWISSAASRRIVHALRGRMDAVVVGAGTARADDPLLTSRPPGPRTASRIVVDSQAALSLDSQLARTAHDASVIVAASESAPAENVRPLQDAGIEVLRLPTGGESSNPVSRRDRPSRPDLAALLDELGRRRMTNVLVEGGGQLLGTCFDGDLIDEVHVFIAPKLVGGTGAPTPLAGIGLDLIPPLSQLEHPHVEVVDGDVYVHGRLRRK